MKKYCTSCGKSIVYSVSDKPKFCDGCGTKLDFGDNLSEKDKDKKEVAAGPRKEDAAQGNYSCNFSKLDVEIQPSRPPSETLGYLIDNPAPNTLASEETRNIPDKSREQILGNFRREAGSLRYKSS